MYFSSYSYKTKRVNRARQTSDVSQGHNNRDLNDLQYLSPEMRVNAKFINSSKGAPSDYSFRLQHIISNCQNVAKTQYLIRHAISFLYYHSHLLRCRRHLHLFSITRHTEGTYQETSSHATRQGTLSHSRLSSLSHCGPILVYRVELVCAR